MDFNTGGPASPGGSTSGPGGAPPRTTGGTADEFNFSDPVGSFVSTVRNVVTQPVNFFRLIRRQGDFVNPLIYAAICALIAAILGGIIGFFGVLVAGDQGFGGAFAGLIGTIILTPIFTAIGLFIGAAITHLLVMLFIGAGNAGFEATFRVVSYVQTTQLVSWIPFIGGLIAFVWGVVLSIFGIREVHSTTTGKAALVVLVPVAVVLLLLFLLFGAILTAIFFGNQQ